MSRIEKTHTLTRRLIILTAISLLFFAGLFGVALIFDQRFMLTWAAFICGIVGGFVSIQQRIKTISDDELTLLSQSWFQVVVIPIFGGVFALVLYSLFLGEMISGNLFPKFDIPSPPPDGANAIFMRDIFRDTYPSSGQDFAKFLFWSFVAGFSERLVPQIIGKVTSSATDDEKKPG